MANKRKHTTTFEDLEKRILSTEEGKNAYAEALQEIELQEMLLKAKERANLKQVDIARYLNVSSAAIHRLENNPGKASIQTINRYLNVCNAHLKLELNYA